MEAFLNEQILSLGYVGVFLLMIFFANELIMPLAGFVAFMTGLWLPGVILAGTAGSTVGSVVIYYAARFLHPETVHRLVGKYGRFVGISAAGTRRAEAWFDRHARGSVALGRFIPGVRSATLFVAGYRHMRARWFLPFTIIPTVISMSILATAGYALSDNYDGLANLLGNFTRVIQTLLVAIVLGFVIYRRVRQHRQHRQQQTS